MKFKIDMNKLRDEIVCNIIRSRFLFSTEKWVTIRLSRWKFSGKFPETCNVATKMNAEKNKNCIEIYTILGYTDVAFL